MSRFSKSVFMSLAVMIAVSTASADDGLSFKDSPAQQVLAVKVDGSDGYAAAFGTLVGYYLKRNIPVSFPQMSIETGGGSFAAIAFTGNAAEGDGVIVLAVPAAKVATSTHKGPYAGLSQAISRTMAAAQQRGCIPDMARSMRLLHPNSPDNTAATDLITEIQIPVTGC